MNNTVVEGVTCPHKSVPGEHGGKEAACTRNCGLFVPAIETIHVVVPSDEDVARYENDGWHGGEVDANGEDPRRTWYKDREHATEGDCAYKLMVDARHVDGYAEAEDEPNDD